MSLHHNFFGALQKAGWSNTKSLLFDGVDEYVQVSNDSSLNITDNLSVSLWFKSTAGGTWHYLVSKSAPANMQYFLRLRTGGDVLLTTYQQGDGSVYRQVRSSATWNDGNWHHVVGTFSGGTMALYIDGSEDTSATFTGSGTSIGTQSVDLTIGAYAQNSQYTPCTLDEITIWDTAVLDSGDVTELYNSGTPQDPTTITTSANLVSYWQMGDSPDTISTIEDRVGTNDGTPVNMESGDIVTDTP